MHAECNGWQFPKWQQYIDEKINPLKKMSTIISLVNKKRYNSSKSLIQMPNQRKVSMQNVTGDGDKTGSKVVSKLSS